MDIEILKGTEVSRSKLNKVRNFLTSADLELDDDIDTTVCVWEDGDLVATGSRAGYLLKCIAVSEKTRGSGYMSSLMGALWQDAFQNGIEEILVYTKPENTAIFESLFFHRLASTNDVVILEREKGAAKHFVLNQVKKSYAEKGRSFDKYSGIDAIGAAVMNCNPFTLGHRYLVEEASKQCDSMYVFVVSEEDGEFSFDERFNLVKRGCADLDNVYVMKTGPYLVSRASFPQYFIKDKSQVSRIKCELDIEIFCDIFAKELGISKRFFGSEPLSETTRAYNEAMKKYLPRKGIEPVEFERIEALGEPISATRVRELFDELKYDQTGSACVSDRLRRLLPETSFDFLIKKAKSKIDI